MQSHQAVAFQDSTRLSAGFFLFLRESISSMCCNAFSVFLCILEIKETSDVLRHVSEFDWENLCFNAPFY